LAIAEVGRVEAEFPDAQSVARVDGDSWFYLPLQQRQPAPGNRRFAHLVLDGFR
jgi:hypothetical protein